MASTIDFVEYVCEQIRTSGEIKFRKMFGEYMVYINEKPLLLVCDNTVFVKQLEPIATLMQGADSGFPYAAAKEHYILDIENADLCQAVIAIIEPITPIPKKRKKKT